MIYIHGTAIIEVIRGYSCLKANKPTCWQDDTWTESLNEQRVLRYAKTMNCGSGIGGISRGREKEKLKSTNWT